MAPIKLAKDIVQGLFQKLRAIALGVTGTHISIVEIPRTEGELGYTSKDNSIHLSFDRPVMDTMKKENKVAFITGVFAHELMHKIATSFHALERMANKLEQRSLAEAKIFCRIFNVMEDPAIEHQAPMYIGGHMLHCLSYSIMTLYKKSPELSPKSSPFGQFMDALIMYGDGGLVKGEFTHPAAKSMFYKVLPIVDQAITCLDNEKRVKLAYDVFVLSKPLWKDAAENEDAMRKLMEELAKNMNQRGKGVKGSGDGKPMNLDPDESAAGSSTEKKRKRRKITFRKVSKEEMDELRKNASSSAGSGDPDGDIEVLYCDEDDSEGEAQNGTGGAGAPDKPQKEETAEPASNNKNEGPGGSGDAAGDEDDSAGTPDAPQKGADGERGEESVSGDDSAKNASKGAEGPQERSDQPACGAFSGDIAPDYDKEEEISDSEYELTDEDVRHVESLIEEILRAASVEKAESDACYAADLDIDMSCDYRGAQCLNQRVKAKDNPTLRSAYEKLIERLSGGINLLANQLRRIMQNAAEERTYRNSGKVSTKRLQSGRLTCQVFQRKLDPTNKADVCVMILVDESGSMSGKKTSCAMQCVVGLAEVFARLRIPVKVIGFTADTSATQNRVVKTYDAVHYHYMHWLNTPIERMNLMSITSRANNFDGYSIRYATKMLQQRKEEHKLFIILSDGQPACRYYHKATGMKDTADAVKEAAKTADVIGVGIGLSNNAEKALFQIYGRHFIHAKNPEDMFSNIGKVVQEIMKKWE